MDPWGISDVCEMVRKMEMDKETVQVVAIVSGTVIAVASLVLDGDLGYAMGTGILSLFSGVMGYVFGRGGCGDAETIPVDDGSA